MKEFEYFPRAPFPRRARASKSITGFNRRPTFRGRFIKTIRPIPSPPRRPAALFVHPPAHPPAPAPAAPRARTDCRDFVSSALPPPLLRFHHRLPRGASDYYRDGTRDSRRTKLLLVTIVLVKGLWSRGKRDSRRGDRRRRRAPAFF